MSIIRIHGFLALVFLVSLVSFVSLGPAKLQAQSEPPEKPPWKWTLEERIEAKYQPQRMQERVERDARKAAVAGYQIPLGQQTISGAENPELFLPVDVLNHSFSTLFSEDREAREVWRLVFEQRLTEAGLEIPSGFYRDLSIVASDELSRLHKVDQGMKELLNLRGAERAKIQREMQALQAGGCSRRQEILAQARRLFGRETFDQWLYVGIAPGMRWTFSYEPGDERTMLLRGRGCK